MDKEKVLKKDSTAADGKPCGKSKSGKRPGCKKEWKKLREDLYEGVNPEKRLVEVLYKGDVILQEIRKS